MLFQDLDSQRWYKFDNRTVTEATFADVETTFGIDRHAAAAAAEAPVVVDLAYLLFYHKGVALIFSFVSFRDLIRIRVGAVELMQKPSLSDVVADTL